MAKEKTSQRDFGQISWEPSPYIGVYVSLLVSEPDPTTPDVPKRTVQAIRVDAQSKIPDHKHNREPNWQETLTFPQGGTFTIRKSGLAETISNTDQITIKIAAQEVFALENLGTEPLYFYSKMEPGFTGYQEIEEVKTAT